MAKVVVSFAVDSEKDRDIVRWLDGLPRRKRSEAIREALRGHLGRGAVTLGDVYQAVKNLGRKLEAGAVVLGGASPSSEEWDEPPEAAAALDALAEL
jgi:hypothetical protein